MEKTFLRALSASFIKFLETGSRSTEKLKILHGQIAKDLQRRLGANYLVLSQGFGRGAEGKIAGRYVEKAVDITIADRAGRPLGGIGVKFVMQNYSQNSNNYFENMLGETANIQCTNIPYFQIFIIPDEIPYYKNSGEIAKWEQFSTHNAEKYLRLSEDDEGKYFHSPKKTLLYVVSIPRLNRPPRKRERNTFRATCRSGKR